MKIFRFFIALVVLCSINSFGQENWTHFTKKEGLASTWIRDCLEDKQGNIWFATDKGVNKYNGEHFEAYTKKQGLPSGFVKTICEDKNGNIWILSGKYSFNPLSLVVNFVPIQYYRDKGMSVIYTDNTLNYLGENPTEDLHFGTIQKDTEGNIWVGGINEKEEKNFILKNFDGKSWETISQFGSFDYDPFFKFYIDENGEIWTFSLTDNFISHFSGADKNIHKAGNGLPEKKRNRFVQLILKDKNNNMWFGAATEEKNGSLFKYDGSNWTNYTDKDGFIGKGVKKIEEDTEGNIWVVTDKGLNRFNGTSWEYYSSKNKLPHDIIEAVTIDTKGRVWIGTAKGLVLFDHGDWKTINKKNGLTHNFVRSIVEDSHGKIWVGAASNWKSGGVSIFDGNVWKQLELPKLWANDFFEDSKGNMWVLTYGNGVIKFE